MITYTYFRLFFKCLTDEALSLASKPSCKCGCKIVNEFEEYEKLTGGSAYKEVYNIQVCDFHKEFYTVVRNAWGKELQLPAAEPKKGSKVFFKYQVGEPCIVTIHFEDGKRKDYNIPSGLALQLQKYGGKKV